MLVKIVVTSVAILRAAQADDLLVGREVCLRIRHFKYPGSVLDETGSSDVRFGFME